MKALEIKIKKFKKLENITAELAGNHIMLIGDNEVGKTTFIQFIEIALGKQTNIPPNATGGGELVMDIKGNRVTFKVHFKDGKPIIKVSGTGISIDNNKSAIAQLVGANSFNIEQFVNQSKSKSGRKEQIEQFKKFLPLEVIQEIGTFENNVLNKMAERTEIGRDIEKLKGSTSQNKLNNLPDFELIKFTHTDTVEVMNNLKTITESNDKTKTVIEGVKKRQLEIDGKNALIKEFQEKIDIANNEIETLFKDIIKGNDYLIRNPLKPTEAIEKTIQDASENNLTYSQAQSLLTDRKNLATYQEEYGEITALIESSREAIANAIRDMDGPIQGLSFDDEQLVYNGIPVNPDCLSKSQIMELGIRLKLAENPELPIFIEEAESLGTDRFMLLKEIADKNNCQIIAEQVQRGLKELHIEIMTDDLITGHDTKN